MDVHELVDDLRQVLDRGVAGVVDDVRRVVVDPDGIAPDLLEQRERDGARGHDVAVDLEADRDPRLLGLVGHRPDVREERGLVLVRRLVAADRGVDDRDAVLGSPAHRLDAVREPLSRRQVGVRRQADRIEPVTLQLAAQLALIGVEVDMLRPARHRRQLDGGIARLRDALQRLVVGVRVVRVRVTRKGVRHRGLHQREGLWGAPLNGDAPRRSTTS